MAKSIAGITATIVTAITLGACSSSGSQTAESDETDSLTLAIDNYINNDTLFRQMIQELPEEKQTRIIEQNKANAVLLKYLRLKDRRYYLDITEKEAEKQGVKPEFYQQCISDLDCTNKIIAEQDSAGNPMELLIPEEMIKQIISINLR